VAQGVFPAGPLSAAPGGLFSAAEVEKHGPSSERWASGPYGWDSIACPAELVLADFCENVARGVIASAPGGSNSSWPFGIVANYECITIGQKPEERRRIALAQLEAGTQKAVERELWSGAIALASGRLDVPHLTDGTAVDVTGGTAQTGVPAALAVAKLEQALADCGLGTSGVIHLTRQAALLAASQHAVVREGDKLFTALGTPVVAGTGYLPSATPKTPASAPVPSPSAPGPAPDIQWGFATGPVHVRPHPPPPANPTDELTTEEPPCARPTP
jgi:hypothetical protein